MARNSRQRPLPPPILGHSSSPDSVLLRGSVLVAPVRVTPRIFLPSGWYIKYLSIPGILLELSINVLVITFDPGHDLRPVDGPLAFDLRRPRPKLPESMTKSRVIGTLKICKRI